MLKGYCLIVRLDSIFQLFYLFEISKEVVNVSISQEIPCLRILHIHH
jgi:hypothetical protein